VEKRRGRGMFVNAGARQALMKDDRQYFLDSEWPKVYAIIQRLGLSVEDLMKRGAKSAPVSQPFPTLPNTGNDDDNDN
jgi:GntR family transcriptional regulator